ncbi:MAG: type II secretion system protein GspG [Alphaproteobacteria bacterium]|nr:type II secretion system protein GspG [Alphaproteobacteria bacterium]
MTYALNSNTARKRRIGQPLGSAGFTLVELLVVLAILGLIAAIAVPQTIGYLGRAKSNTAGIQIDNLGAVLDLYRLDVGRYPSDSEGLDALMNSPVDARNWAGPYLKKESSLLDPWSRPYQYRFPGQNGEYDLFTLGADGQEGGDGENRDVVSWQ